MEGFSPIDKDFSFRTPINSIAFHIAIYPGRPSTNSFECRGVLKWYPINNKHFLVLHFHDEIFALKVDGIILEI